MIGRLVSSILNAVPRNAPTNGFARSLDVAFAPPNQCQWNFTSVRTKFFFMTKPRYNFPNPSEYKRVTRYGWNARISTPSGRKILMRRILKGRHVLSH
ncbi:hypothetical protein KPH14_002884 [Odynerus spinipes]|uniref:Large ribosomal subunit protein bL34m n=1 Tax=Odynerus spinipes TaxID=1348599 RepID=A0AAD9RWC9_9HYME|nr:hypothetical protein KPH14_002884 [Odynerus spinipes]